MKKIYLLAWGMALTAWPLSGAWAQRAATGDLEQRLSQVESYTQRNNQEMAKAVNLMEQTQRDFQSIKGQVEAANYLDKENNRVYEDLDRRVASLEDKVEQIHRLLSELKQGSTGGTAAGASGTPLTEGEMQEYQALLTIFNSRDYRAAASGFLGFVKKYPQGSEAGNAQFWAGESFYSMGDYVRAIKEYQRLVEAYPQNKRIPEAVYRQGLAFLRLQKNTEATLFFQKVLADYPNTPEAAQAQTQLHRLQEKSKSPVALNSGGAEAPEAVPSGESLPPPEDGAPRSRPLMKTLPMPGSSSEGAPGAVPQETESAAAPADQAPAAMDPNSPLF